MSDMPLDQRTSSLGHRASLTKQARIYETESDKVANGHIAQILIHNSGLGGAEEDLEDTSSASTEIVSVRSKREGGGRSQSADRILEEDLAFTRAELVKQGSEGSYLSWQSEGSVGETDSYRQSDCLGVTDSYRQSDCLGKTDSYSLSDSQCMSNLLDSTTQLHDSVSKLHNSEQKVDDGELKLHDSALELHDSESKLYDSESKLHNSASHIHETKSLVQDSQPSVHVSASVVYDTSLSVPANVTTTQSNCALISKSASDINEREALHKRAQQDRIGRERKNKERKFRDRADRQKDRQKTSSPDRHENVIRHQAITHQHLANKEGGRISQTQPGRSQHGRVDQDSPGPPRPESQPPPLLYRGVSPLLSFSHRRGSGYWAARRSYTAYAGSSWAGETMERSVHNRFAAAQFRHSSSDILDRLPSRRTRSRLDQVETGLMIGNMDAATDILSLETHGITHIVTVDSVPLPRKITSLLPRLACLHVQVTDIPSEDLLSHLPSVLSFIAQGQSQGSVLVHCYYGRSRSATVVIAYLMTKYRLCVEKAVTLVRAARPTVQPNPGFMAQLRLWESMQFRVSPSYHRYKLYRLHMLGEKMRKCKLVGRETLLSVTDSNPGVSPLRSAAIVYKCKSCRHSLATCHNTLPHQVGVNPYWYSAQPTAKICSQSVHLFPLAWMEETVRISLSGKLLCPGCRVKLGTFSWVLGSDCPCGAKISPAFTLDNTAIIFKTGGKHLAGSSEVRQSRRPVEV